MRDVAVIGLGMHPWGKFADRSVQQLCRVAVDAALKDAGVPWRDIEAGVPLFALFHRRFRFRGVGLDQLFRIVGS